MQKAARKSADSQAEKARREADAALEKIRCESGQAMEKLRREADSATAKARNEAKTAQRQLKEMEEAGVQVNEVADKQQFRDAVKPIHEAFAADVNKELLDKINEKIAEIQ